MTDPRPPELPVAGEASLAPGRLARPLLIGFLLCELALVVLDYQVNYGRATEIGALRRLFNTAREDGLASWFGTMQTSLIALTLWGAYATARHLRAPGARRWGWAALAVFFTYMAADDGAKIHERLGTTFEVLTRGATPGLLGRALAWFPSYAWQVVFLPFFGAMGLFLLVFLWREAGSDRTRVTLVAALGLLVTAVGLDFVEGLTATHPLNPYTFLASYPPLADFSQARFGKPAFDTLRHFSKSIEEFFEMFANTLLWTVILHCWGRLARGLRVRFVE